VLAIRALLDNVADLSTEHIRLVSDASESMYLPFQRETRGFQSAEMNQVARNGLPKTNLEKTPKVRSPPFSVAPA